MTSKSLIAQRQRGQYSKNYYVYYYIANHYNIDKFIYYCFNNRQNNMIIDLQSVN